MDSIFNDMNLVMDYEIDQVYLFMKKSSFLITLRFLSQFIRQKFVFETSFLDYELLQIHYLSKKLAYALKARIHLK